MVVISVISGCTAPYVPQPYAGKATVQSSRTVSVLVEPGEIYGLNAELEFNVEDEYAVARHLERELARLGIARLAGGTEPDGWLRLKFIRTRHLPEFQEYVLDVEVHFGNGEKAPKRRYHVLSSEGDSILTKMSTDASEGKQKAVAKLLRVLIPDVEAWVRDLPPLQS